MTLQIQNDPYNRNEARRFSDFLYGVQGMILVVRCRHLVALLMHGDASEGSLPRAGRTLGTRKANKNYAARLFEACVGPAALVILTRDISRAVTSLTSTGFSTLGARFGTEDCREV